MADSKVWVQFDNHLEGVVMTKSVGRAYNCFGCTLTANGHDSDVEEEGGVKGEFSAFIQPRFHEGLFFQEDAFNVIDTMTISKTAKDDQGVSFIREQAVLTGVSLTSTGFNKSAGDTDRLLSIAGTYNDATYIFTPVDEAGAAAAKVEAFDTSCAGG
ncbi:hypothetical protein [Pelagibaculum spongiae]|uniref:Uncharacterized protein n=1 Tax=Pelagibaculum spongiae TaxID=2080658 RepID=A0A2V1GTH5_9GAMM|nr:hypothetical protein [Pelagibaculum spongiae]PVZ67686.1 hypothetical protein DC094_14720 [Pelagibaculum spongiae]